MAHRCRDKTVDAKSSQHISNGVGYHKKEYSKPELKILLKPCKNQKPKDNREVSANSPIRPRPCAEASDERPKAPRPAEVLSPRPSHRGPAPKGLGQDANSPIRPRLGSATTSSPPPRRTPLTKRHASNHSHDVSHTWAQYSRVADGT